MNVLGVFGSNLRLLCRAHSSQANVAQALDISKVQFQRYLNGESFPKPHALQRFCEFFGVDARILTDPLDDRSAQAIVERRRRGGVMLPKLSDSDQDPLAQAMRWAAPVQDFFPRHPLVADGIYQFWRNSLSQPGQVAVTLIRIWTEGAARLMRGFVTRAYLPEGAPAQIEVAGQKVNQREFRGVVLDTLEGAHLQIFYPPPHQWVANVFVSTNYVGYDGSFSGFYTMGRREYPGTIRMARTYLMPVQADARAILKARRAPVWMGLDDAPSSVRRVLAKPVG